MRQLAAGLADLPDGCAESIAIAYEPVWCIGTGQTATTGDATAVHAEVRRYLAARFPGGAEIPILYGGSVNTANAKALMSAEGVDGLLVGGASLDIEGWASICDT
jgi:triosephosphate isomerase